MLTKIAWQMLIFRRLRLVATICGLAFLFFLSAAQVGLLVGWCHTVSAIIRHAGGDVWVMAERTQAFDYGTAIPEQRLYQVRSSPNVLWAEPMFMGWLFLHRPDGRRANIELIGIGDEGVGGPWAMAEGEVAVVHEPDALIVDELFLDQLGVPSIGTEVEIAGRRAILRGISREVRTLTAAPFCFCSLENARRYDVRYRPDEITYVIAKARPGVDPQALAEELRLALYDVEVLTTRDFAVRSMAYWMLETGVGITVVITALLGFVVGGLVTSQTLYAITNDHLPNYATLLAVGFSRLKLAAVVLVQSLVLGGSGTLLGTVLFIVAAHISADTPIPLEATPLLYLALVIVNLVVCVGSAALAMRTVLTVDPVVVFGGHG